MNYNLSEKVKNYLDKLNDLISNVNYDDQRVINNITNLELGIQNENDFTNKDLVILYSATSVSKYSYNYWSKNYGEWAKLSSSNRKGLMMKSSPGGNIVKADVAGAVGGAATAWVVNALPGPGQVAYGGAIVGGAVGGSVYQGVVELLDWLW